MNKTFRRFFGLKEEDKCKHLEDPRISEVVQKDEGDGSYAINGCCGGGCYVIYGIRFCPYCGEELK